MSAPLSLDLGNYFLADAGFFFFARALAEIHAYVGIHISLLHGQAFYSAADISNMSVSPPSATLFLFYFFFSPGPGQPTQARGWPSLSFFFSLSFFLPRCILDSAIRHRRKSVLLSISFFSHFYFFPDASSVRQRRAAGHSCRARTNSG